MSKFLVQATWDDVPHLSQKDKDDLWRSIPEYQRDARSKGIPQLGSGAIYQIAEERIKIDPFKIPDHWPRGYGMDVGWNRTAALWFAADREAEVLYAYSEHYYSKSKPDENADAVKARGIWIPGFIDPASRGRSQIDGDRLFRIYTQDCGLKLTKAKNAVEAGIYEVWQLMTAGKLKIFANLSNFWAEYRLYRRDDDGKVVKEFDHLMDAMRYFILSGRNMMAQKPVDQEIALFDFGSAVPSHAAGGWMS